MSKATMTVKEMAGTLGISEPIAYQLAAREDFPSIKIGRRILIPIDAFNAWLAAQATAKA